VDPVCASHATALIKRLDNEEMQWNWGAPEQSLRECAQVHDDSPCIERKKGHQGILNVM